AERDRQGPGSHHHGQRSLGGRRYLLPAHAPRSGKDGLAGSWLSKETGAFTRSGDRATGGAYRRLGSAFRDGAALPRALYWTVGKVPCAFGGLGVSSKAASHDFWKRTQISPLHPPFRPALICPSWNTTMP